MARPAVGRAAPLLALLAALAALAALPPAAGAADAQRRGARIISGQEAAAGEFPAAVRVEVMSEQERTGALDVAWCGGSVLSESWVLTGGHCFGRPSMGFLPIAINIYVGSRSIFAAEHRTSAGNPRHLEQRRASSGLGLIRLDEPLRFSDLVQPARLPEQGQVFPADSEATVVGWGETEGDCCAQELRKHTFRGFRYDGDLLIGRGENEGPCFGDFGGPLYIGDVTVGVSSSVVDDEGGEDCLLPGEKHYINVALYRDWIRQETGV